MAESAQQVAKRVLADLESLVAQGKIQSFQLQSLRTELEPLANPPPPPIAARPPSSASQSHRKRFRAIWSYNGVQEDELTFAENDQIELTEEVSEGWWRGCVVRPDGSRGQERMFPSNYVEVIPDNVGPSGALTAFSPPLPPRSNAIGFPQPNSTDDEKRAGGYHGLQSPATAMQQQQQALGPPRWQPGVARWNSGAPPSAPPPPPNQFSPSPSPGSAGGYYNQPPMPYGGNTPDAFGHQNPPIGQMNTTQPMPVTEEEKKKHDKLKKIGGRLGNRMAGGFAGGVGFGIGANLMKKFAGRMGETMAGGFAGGVGFGIGSHLF